MEPSLPTDPPPYLTSLQLARMLGLAETTLRRWRTERRGPSWTKLGGAVRYSRSEIDAWLSANAKATQSNGEIDT